MQAEYITTPKLSQKLGQSSQTGIPTDVGQLKSWQLKTLQLCPSVPFLQTPKKYPDWPCVKAQRICPSSHTILKKRKKLADRKSNKMV